MTSRLFVNPSPLPPFPRCRKHTAAAAKHKEEDAAASATKKAEDTAVVQKQEQVVAAGAAAAAALTPKEKALTLKEKAAKEAQVRSHTVSASEPDAAKATQHVSRATRARLHGLGGSVPTSSSASVGGGSGSTGSWGGLPAGIPRYYHPLVHVNAAAHEYPPPDLAVEALDELQCNIVILQV